MSLLPFFKSLRPYFERSCLLGWMVLITVNTVFFGFAVELFVWGSALSSSQIYIINERTVPFLFYGVIASVGFPLILRMWEYGVDNLNFHVHECAFNKMAHPPDSWSDGIMALLDENASRTGEIIMLVRLIEEAPGPVERQDRRAEAKAWLKTNREKLSVEDRDYVRQNLGYLIW